MDHAVFALYALVISVVVAWVWIRWALRRERMKRIRRGLP